MNQMTKNQTNSVNISRLPTSKNHKAQQKAHKVSNTIAITFSIDIKKGTGDCPVPRYSSFKPFYGILLSALIIPAWDNVL